MAVFVRIGVALAGFFLLLTAAYYTRETQPPGQPLRPFAHWKLDAKNVRDGKVPDALGKLPGTALGSPRATADGLEFDGPDDGVQVMKSVAAGAAFLPAEAFTVASWVRVDARSEWAGILGCFQDNGPREKGFVVGVDRDHFFFGLATHGADDGDGKITYLRGKTAYVPGRWYCVVATYDGKTMALSVNGEVDATSAAQSGRVLYADKAPLVIGRYTDDDEDFPLAGAIREVQWCDYAAAPADVAAYFTANAALAARKPEPPATTFVIEPYLQWVTQTTAVVMCETAAATACRVEYGETYPPANAAESAGPATLHEVKLTGLTPRTNYFYRVVCSTADGRRLVGRTLTFQSAVGDADAFSFTAVGDTQANPAVTGKIAKLMWERRPNFVLHCGDVVDEGADKRMWTEELFKPCRGMFGRVAVVPCIGNHEKNHPNYYKYFSLPAPEYHYSYRYGNAEFFSIDSNKNRNLTPSGEQYAWLDRALAASTARWKICFHHHPAFSSDSDDYGNTAKGKSALGDPRVRPLQALYEKHGVDIVFNGHIHLYERSWPLRGNAVDQKRGVVHVTTGGGGGRLEDFAPTPSYFKAETRVDFHFCYVTVHAGTLNFKAFDQEGRLFDQFSIGKE